MLEKICGMRVKNTYKGPAALLAEVEDDQGNQNIALVFQEEYHEHPLLNDSLSGIMSFLHNPVIPGIADLIQHEKGQGSFVFNTGPCISIAQMIRRMGDAGITPGPRAGLEFMERAGRILTDTSEYTINTFAVGSHGSLNPWRILARRNGAIQIIGYAIPQVEMKDFHRDPNNIPREDSFRYCPPERVSNHPEDLSSDIFVLALIAFEIMVTRPVYDGTVDDIRQKAVRGEASRQLMNYQSVLPKYVRNFLSKALKGDRRHRFTSSQAFFSELESILRRPDLPGMSFNSIVAKMEQMPKQVLGADLVSVETSTSIFGKDKLLEQYGLSQEDSAVQQDFVVPANSSSPAPNKQEPSKESNNPFWSPVTRSSSSQEKPQPQSQSKPMWGKVSRSSNSVASQESPMDAIRKKKQDTASKLRSSLSSKKEKVDPSELINLLSKGRSGKNKVPVVPPAPNKNKSSIPKVPPPPPEINVAPPDDFLSKNSSERPPDLPPIHKSEAKKPEVKTTIPTLPPKQNTSIDVLSEKLPEKKVQAKKAFVPEPQKSDTGLAENPFMGPILEFSPFFEKGELNNYILHLNTHKIRFRAKSDSLSSSVLATSLIGRKIPIRMDPMGRISGWFRFASADGFHSGRTPMSQISGAELSLVVVPNELRWVEISVPKQGITVMTSVGSAIPMLSIIDHLVCWLQLSGGGWSILVNNQKTDYYDILDDFQQESTYTLTLQQN